MVNACVMAELLVVSHSSNVPVLTALVNDVTTTLPWKALPPKGTVTVPVLPLTLFRSLDGLVETPTRWKLALADSVIVAVPAGTDSTAEQWPACTMNVGPPLTEKLNH